MEPYVDVRIEKGARANTERVKKTCALEEVKFSRGKRKHFRTNLRNNSVYVHFDLGQILDIDEKNGIWTAKMLRVFFYQSNSTIWDPNDYNGTDYLYLPEKMFWGPDISKTF